jgi:hypothetical protein
MGALISLRSRMPSISFRRAVQGQPQHFRMGDRVGDLLVGLLGLFVLLDCHQQRSLREPDVHIVFGLLPRDLDLGGALFLVGLRLLIVDAPQHDARLHFESFPNFQGDQRARHQGGHIRLSTFPQVDEAFDPHLINVLGAKVGGQQR